MQLSQLIYSNTLKKDLTLATVDDKQTDNLEFGKVGFKALVYVQFTTRLSAPFPTFP